MFHRTEEPIRSFICSFWSDARSSSYNPFPRLRVPSSIFVLRPMSSASAALGLLSISA